MAGRPASTRDPECLGACLSAADIGLPGGTAVAYPHPMCPAHGEPHSFSLDRADRVGRLVCECGAYQSEHPDQGTVELLTLEAERERAHGYLDRGEELLRSAALLRTMETMSKSTEHQEERA